MSIKQKEKVCLGCGLMKKIFSKGRCLQCTPKTTLKKTPIKQKAYTIPKQTQKNKEYRKSQSAIRDEYFETLIPLCTHSEESGVPIYNTWRGNVCHLFPKRTYKSIQGNLNNYVYLTLEEHTLFDKFLDNHDFVNLELKFPNSWKIACERILILLPLCLERGKLYFKLEEYLNERT